MKKAPFSSERKRMSTIVKLPDKKEQIFMKGASEYLIECSDKYHDL